MCEPHPRKTVFHTLLSHPAFSSLPIAHGDMRTKKKKHLMIQSLTMVDHMKHLKIIDLMDTNQVLTVRPLHATPRGHAK